MKKWKPYFDLTNPWDRLCGKLHAAREAHWAAPTVGDVDEYLKTSDELRAVEQEMNEYCRRHAHAT
jgi:hypothetical protein